MSVCNCVDSVFHYSFIVFSRYW